MKEKTTEYIIIKKELDKIRQKEYYNENKQNKPKQDNKKFQVIKEKTTLFFN